MQESRGKRISYRNGNGGHESRTQEQHVLNAVEHCFWLVWLTEAGERRTGPGTGGHNWWDVFFPTCPAGGDGEGGIAARLGSRARYVACRVASLFFFSLT